MLVTARPNKTRADGHHARVSGEEMIQDMSAIQTWRWKIIARKM
jgi:hypothetical protein